MRVVMGGAEADGRSGRSSSRTWTPRATRLHVRMALIFKVCSGSGRLIAFGIALSTAWARGDRWAAAAVQTGLASAAFAKEQPDRLRASIVTRLSAAWTCSRSVAQHVQRILACL